MDQSHAIRLFDSKQVPESRLLLWKIFDVIVILRDGLDPLEKTDRTLEICVIRSLLVKLFDELLSDSEVKISWNLGTIDGTKIHCVDEIIYLVNIHLGNIKLLVKPGTKLRSCITNLSNLSICIVKIKESKY